MNYMYLYFTKRISNKFFSTTAILNKHFSPDNIFSPLNKVKFQECSNIDHRWTYNADHLMKIRQAAVLVPLCIVDPADYSLENVQIPLIPSSSILFIRRTKFLFRNSGDISFPGGIFEIDKDQSLKDTALRETLEEVGLNPDRIDLWSELNPFPSRDLKTLITPFVGFVSGGFINESQLKLCETEVEQAIFVPIRDLCNPNNIAHTQYKIAGKMTYSLPIYFVKPPKNNHNKFIDIKSKSLEDSKIRIWGLTAIILHHVLKILLPPSVYGYKIPLIPKIETITNI
ncbi:unnamed protein product [Gordionus sp. m RMFG-2023]|uniref:nudix hydrolase 3-like n=1 Tax=Gordionus sp. m RMFG-2023 TaxID=3053472 RepID=UPI0030DE0390